MIREMSFTPVQVSESPILSMSPSHRELKADLNYANEQAPSVPVDKEPFYPIMSNGITSQAKHRNKIPVAEFHHVAYPKVKQAPDFGFSKKKSAIWPIIYLFCFVFKFLVPILWKIFQNCKLIRGSFTFARYFQTIT